MHARPRVRPCATAAAAPSLTTVAALAATAANTACAKAATNTSSGSGADVSVQQHRATADARRAARPPSGDAAGRQLRRLRRL